MREIRNAYSILIKRTEGRVRSWNLHADGNDMCQEYEQIPMSLGMFQWRSVIKIIIN